MMVMLLQAGAGEPSVGPRATRELARLGVTRVVLLRDEESVGVLLEGWALDPERAAGEAMMAVGGEAPTRTLHPIAEISISVEEPRRP